jgi:hypothetical protein
MKRFWHDVVQFLARSRKPSLKGRRPSHRSLTARRQLRVEALEDRLLPALFTPLPGTPDGDPGSLRADIIAANGNGEDNVIQLQAGVYNLTKNNPGNVHEVGAATGDLGVTSPGHTLTILGADATATVIDANAIDDRVFQVLPKATLVLQDLTVTGGSAVDDGTAGAVAYQTDSRGGGILNEGNLRLDHVRLRVNRASGVLFSPSAGTPATNAAGGGIYSTGDLEVRDSIIDQNTAWAGAGGDGLSVGLAHKPGNAGLPGGTATGGGVYVGGGNAAISNSTLSGNTALGGLGGNGSDGGPSIGLAGWAGGNGGQGGVGAGGALYEFGGVVTLSDSTVSGNWARGGQGGRGGNGSATGGLFAGGAGGVGGNGSAGEGGGLAVGFGHLTVSNATVALNTSQGGKGGDGGARGASVFPAKSGNGGNGGASQGGGLFVSSLGLFLQGVADVHNSTIAFNTSDANQGGAAGGALAVAGQGAMGQGGGVRQEFFGVVNAVSSIFAKNSALQPNGTNAPAMDFSGQFNLATAQHNLLGDNTGSNLLAGNPDPNGNRVGTKVNPIDPLLMPLDNNGGPTRTLALQPNSPAIDAGSNPDGLTTDQRGYGPRDFNGATDIGAYEFGAVPPKKGGAAGEGTK